MADTFEALTGAIYLDQGYQKAQKFVEKFLISDLPRIIELELFRDPKSQLQEIIQEEVSVTPEYRVLEEHGPDHQRHFIVGVFTKDKMVGKGEGGSKKEAEEEAAKSALENKIWSK